MPAKKEDNRMIIRMPDDLKSRLEIVAKELQELHPEGEFSVSSVVRAAIAEKVAELEKKIKGEKKK